MFESLTDSCEQLRLVVAPEVDSGLFDPVRNWAHLGLLIGGMEERDCYLMLNSAHTSGLRRIAAFHVRSDLGFPCAGSSEWGPFETIGEAVVRAAHEALFTPRTP